MAIWGVGRSGVLKGEYVAWDELVWGYTFCVAGVGGRLRNTPKHVTPRDPLDALVPGLLLTTIFTDL